MSARLLKANNPYRCLQTLKMSAIQWLGFIDSPHNGWTLPLAITDYSLLLILGIMRLLELSPLVVDSRKEVI